MRKSLFIPISVVIIAVLIAVAFLITRRTVNAPTVTNNTPAATVTPIPFKQTVSDGSIIFGVPDDFGVATTKDQVLVKSYIPPCSEGFNYCLYYNGTAFSGTNFESAGVSITKRKDLDSEQACLSTLPEGYAVGSGPTPSNLVPKVLKQTDYSSSVFSPIGDAGAGHYASGAVYRLFANGTCHEIETRIGQTQFANYPPGAIKQFTPADFQAMTARLGEIVDNIHLMNGEKAIFPDITALSSGNTKPVQI
jgi:hypothetical protein